MYIQNFYTARPEPRTFMLTYRYRVDGSDTWACWQMLSMYLWLSHHFPEELFVQKERAAAMATHIATLLGQSLTQSAGHWHRRGRKPGLKKVNGRVVAARPGLRPRVLGPSSRTQESTVVDREPITVPAVC